jgi:hypothetical protein
MSKVSSIFIYLRGASPDKFYVRIDNTKGVEPCCVNVHVVSIEPPRTAFVDQRLLANTAVRSSEIRFCVVGMPSIHC